MERDEELEKLYDAARMAQIELEDIYTEISLYVRKKAIANTSDKAGQFYNLASINIDAIQTMKLVLSCTLEAIRKNGQSVLNVATLPHGRANL